MSIPQGLPVVDTTAMPPESSIPRKLCGALAAIMASIAACKDPSVEFLKPTGIDRPLAIWR